MSYYRPSKFMDFHVHVFPDDVAAKAMEMFRVHNIFPTLGDGTVAGTLAIMEEAGIDLIVTQPVATSPAQVKGINDWSVSIRSDRLVPFGAMHPEFTHFREEINRLVDLGFRGVKLQPGWQNFYPDEERVFPLYEALEGKLAVLFHAGDELNRQLKVMGLAHCFRTVHDRLPGLTMILAHMGAYRQWDEVEEHLLGSHVYFDNSYCPDNELPDEEMVRMIRAHGADKIVFGTDFPLRNPAEDAERLSRLGLTDEEKDAIAWGNGARLLGL